MRKWEVTLTYIKRAIVEAPDGPAAINKVKAFRGKARLWIEEQQHARRLK